MATKKNVRSTRSTKPKKTKALCYVYGGALKSKHTYFFVTDYQDKDGIIDFVKNNFVQFYGSVLSGRYIPCVDAENALEQVVELAKSDGYDLDGHIITASVGNSTALLKKATNEETAHTFTINNHPDDNDIELEEEPVSKPSSGKQNKESKSTTPKTNASKNKVAKKQKEESEDELNDEPDDEPVDEQVDEQVDELDDEQVDKNDDDPDENDHEKDMDDVAPDKNDDDELVDDEEPPEKEQKVKKPAAKKGAKVTKSPAKKPAAAKQTVTKTTKKPKAKNPR